MAKRNKTHPTGNAMAEPVFWKATGWLAGYSNAIRRGNGLIPMGKPMASQMQIPGGRPRHKPKPKSNLGRQEPLVRLDENPCCAEALDLPWERHTTPDLRQIGSTVTHRRRFSPPSLFAALSAPERSLLCLPSSSQPSIQPPQKPPLHFPISSPHRPGVSVVFSGEVKRKPMLCRGLRFTTGIS
jgi:hypothetical protein